MIYLVATGSCFGQEPEARREGLACIATMDLPDYGPLPVSASLTGEVAVERPPGASDGFRITQAVHPLLANAVKSVLPSMSVVEECRSVKVELVFVFRLGPVSSGPRATYHRLEAPGRIVVSANRRPLHRGPATVQQSRPAVP
jgi:hypothetical protein